METTHDGTLSNNCRHSFAVDQRRDASCRLIRRTDRSLFCSGGGPPAGETVRRETVRSRLVYGHFDRKDPSKHVRGHVYDPSEEGTAMAMTKLKDTFTAERGCSAFCARRLLKEQRYQFGSRSCQFDSARLTKSDGIGTSRGKQHLIHHDQPSPLIPRQGHCMEYVASWSIQLHSFERPKAESQHAILKHVLVYYMKPCLSLPSHSAAIADLKQAGGRKNRLLFPARSKPAFFYPKALFPVPSDEGSCETKRDDVFSEYNEVRSADAGPFTEKCGAIFMSRTCHVERLAHRRPPCRRIFARLPLCWARNTSTASRRELRLPHSTTQDK